MRLSVLLLILIVMNYTAVYADMHDSQSSQTKQIETGAQPDLSQNTQVLNLTIDPDIIKESEEKQKTANKKNNPLLPDIFKNQKQNNISMESGLLINDEAVQSEIIDGAEISIKVRTD